MEEREIKFRAWNGTEYISPNYIDRKGLAWWREDSIPTYSNIVEQFTGLHDKNGKEIYEGDYLHCGDFILEVCWVQCYARFMLDTNSSLVPIDKGFCSNSEVIGNIHENPELLKERGVKQ